MIESELLLAHNLFSNKGAYCLFLGSGISRPAGIPTGWEVLVKLITDLAILKTGAAPSDAANWYKEFYQKTPNYSQIIEELTATAEERLNLLRPFFEATAEDISQGLKQPTPAHRAIATLVQKGYIRVIVTTNFDRLMENALKDLGIEATVISNPLHIENVMPLIHSPITIIKINGDYLDTKFLNIESELSNYNDDLVALLRFIFENFGLITVGWSAQWDIALREILESANKFRFGNYFSYLNKYDDALERLCNARRGKLIKIKGADNFFKELLENIEALEKGSQQNPLTKQVAVARLRKYIAREDLKIPLFELIKDHQDAAFHTIFNIDLLPKPEKDSVKEMILFRIKQIETLCALLAEGVYWGKPYHYEYWFNILQRFCNPVRERSSYAIWNNLGFLPALFIFYTIGIGAILKRDYLLLNRLFHLKIANPYREGQKFEILNQLSAEEIITKSQLNEVFGTNKIAPLSELLFSTIKPFFINFLPSDNDYENLFDEFELIYALKFMEIMHSDWFPTGRYAYMWRHNNDHIIYTKFIELEYLKEADDWIVNKLFSNSDGLIKLYSTFNSKVKQMGW